MSVSFIGALMALLPPSLFKTFDRIDKNLDKLDGLATQMEIERLREEERMARELSNAHAALAMEKLVSAHWKEEAKRLARSNRVDREAWEREREQLRRVAYDWQVRALPPNMRGAQQLQAHQNATYQQLAMQQAQQAQINSYAALGQQNAFQDGAFCNCVPGRSQVFLADHRAFTADERLARLRP